MTLAINKNDEKTKQNKKRLSMKFVYSHFIALNSFRVAVVTTS